MGSLSKNLPSDITSYDLLKTFAIITMIIDHIGAYMMPEFIELRAIGRLSAPVWFFLIGYALNRKLELRLWIGAIILMIGHYLINEETLPLNILFTFLLIRLTLNPLMKFLEIEFLRVLIFFIPLFVLSIFTMDYIEYGVLGYYCAISGYLVRHKDRLNMDNKQITILVLLAFIAYWMNQTLLFGFNSMNSAFVLFSFFILATILSEFKSKTYPELTEKLGSMKHVVFLTGRRTLEIYVIHVLAFKAFGAFVLGLDVP